MLDQGATALGIGIGRVTAGAARMEVLRHPGEPTRTQTSRRAPTGDR
jgi:hypothetical protein